MDLIEWLNAYWQAVFDQDKQKMRDFIHPQACIRWHNTNECFTCDEFIRVNCEYPGAWQGRIEMVSPISTGVFTITHVYNSANSFHVTSLMQREEGKLISLDEYWSEDGEAPEWRKQLGLGTMIHNH